MTTQQLLNEVAYPNAGTNVRRKYMQYYDTFAVATGTTTYNLFSTTLGNNFQRNKKFPLSGSEAFALMNVELFLQSGVNTTAEYDALLDLLQKSYLEIVVNSKQAIKIPGIEIFSFDYSDIVIGTTTAINYNTKSVKRKKNLIIPIFFNSNSAIDVNFVTTTSAATAYNGKNVLCTFSGIQSDKLDNIFFNPVQGNFQDLAYTMYDTVAVSGAGQNTYELFKDSSKSKTLYSKTLNLSSVERFEVQNMEIFFSMLSGGSNLFNAIKNNRMVNQLQIKIEDVLLYESTIADFLSLSNSEASSIISFAGIAINAYASSDAATLPTVAVPSNTATFTRTIFQYKSKSLEIPIIFPANGKVSVELTQPGSSLNVDQYFTVLLKGKLTRQVG
jgi:hypothetical protein